MPPIYARNGARARRFLLGPRQILALASPPMCTRFTLHNLTALTAMLARLGVTGPADQAPRYNIPVTTLVPVVARREGANALGAFRFGVTLPPRTAGERPTLLANARAETVRERPAFRDAVRHRRCLVPADGFFEWEHAGRARQPHYFHRRDGATFYFAGLWRPEPDPAAPPGFVLVTTTPNNLVTRLHDRMPVVLEPETAPEWLGDQPLAPERLADLCAPWPADAWTSHPVHPRMNHARHAAPDCVAPWTPPAPEPTLFD